MNLIESLNWRYATKRMNGQVVPSEKVNTILEAIKLAPSSMGLQPFKCIVIENPEFRAKIHEKACPQPQILEGSHVIVFAGYRDITLEHIQEYMQRIAVERNIPIESLKDFSDMIWNSIKDLSAEQKANWAARQAYIALGVGLVSAAVENVDATPMEGFSNAALDEVLNLKVKNLQSLAILTLGYRDANNDYLVNLKKVRKPFNDFFEVI